MFQQNYYYLVAGLREYSLDGDTKGFDALSAIAEIKEGVSKSDRRVVEMLYTYYDIENIVNIRAGRTQFSPLGNFSRIELEEELVQPSHLPDYLGEIITAYNESQKESSEEDLSESEVDFEATLERNLFAAYYVRCAKSKSKFIRLWCEFDRTLRNIAAALAARRLGKTAADVIVGSGEIESALSRSSAADFGIRGEVGYIDQVMAAVAESGNLIDKERKMDVIRWDMVDELTAMNYFDIDFLLGYLVRVNIIYRWAALDPDKGRELLKKLISSLTESDPVSFQPKV